MRKHIVIIILSVIFVCVYGARSVDAHTLKIDGAIGVSVHINPDDEPIVGRESAIFVEITDSAGRFNAANPSNCLCTLTIFSDGVRVAQLPIVSGGSYTQMRFVFPTSGKYTLVVEGKPNGEGQLFQRFSLTYEYFVHGEIGSDEVNPLLAFIPYVQALCGAIIIWMFISIRRR